MSQLNMMMSRDPLGASPNKSSKARRIVAALFLVATLLFITYAFISFRGATTPTDYVGLGSGEVVVVVSRGDSLTSIAESLQKADVVMSVDAFLAAVKADDRSSTIGPGKYSLHSQMSGVGALQLMLDPTSRSQSRLVIPEGLTTDETVAIASKTSGLPTKGFTESLKSPQDLGLPTWAEDRPEGFMFPATYDLIGDETPTGVLKSMVTRFNQASTDLNLVSRAESIDITPYDSVIVASLLQAEGTPNDFGKVARVIYNRLEAGMPLQFDSTISYALGVQDLQLSADQLATKSPYNTHLNVGLPPTPINSPGDAAIDAALSPAKGKWLYFVTVDPSTGETKFTKSYDKFLKLKAEFQANMAE